MKKKTLIIGLSLMVLTGCAIIPYQKEQSQLQIRSYQTRSWPITDSKLILKACINVLQDDGYSVKNAVPEMGLIVAEKQARNESFGEVFWFGILTVSREATVNITAKQSETTVRVNFLDKKSNAYGGPFSVMQIDDEKFYQEFFAKVDKGIYLQKEGL